MKLFIRILAVIVMTSGLHAQSPASNLRLNDDPAGAEQGGARIALDRNGTIYVAWTDFRSNGNGDIYLSRSTDGGATFSPNRAVYTGGTVQSGMQRGVAMAIDSMGGIHMVWMETKRSDLPELRYTRSTDGGATFSQPVYIGGPAGIAAQDFPSVGIDAENNLYVAWVDDRETRNGTGSNTQIYFTRSTDRGSTFGAPARASLMPGGIGGSCECCNTAMAVSPDGHIYISFRSNIKNRRDIFVARSLNRGESFDVAMPAASEQWMLQACPMSGSSIALDREETAHIVWRDSRPSAQGKDYIYHAMLFYGANSCTADMRISATPSRSNFPSIAIAPAGAIVCSFQDNRRDPADIFSVYSLDGGNGFTAASNIADDPGTSLQREPSSAVGPDGTRYTVWSDERRDAGDIYFTRDAAPLTLIAPDRVSPVLPADGVTMMTFKEFSWGKPSNMPAARNLAYDLTMVKDGVPTVVRDIHASSYTTSLGPGSYRWYVVAHTPSGRSAPSDTFSFTLSPDQQAGVREGGRPAPMLLRGISTSPASDELRVRFALDRPRTVTFSVIGEDGARRMTLGPRGYEAGERSETIDIGGLSAGAYLLEVRSPDQRGIMKFSIVR